MFERIDLRVATFGQYIQVNKENCGLVEPVQMVPKKLFQDTY